MGKLGFELVGALGFDYFGRDTPFVLLGIFDTVVFIVSILYVRADLLTNK